jgi:hypothetical protein
MSRHYSATAKPQRTSWEPPTYWARVEDASNRSFMLPHPSPSLAYLKVFREVHPDQEVVALAEALVALQRVQQRLVVVVTKSTGTDERLGLLKARVGGELAEQVQANVSRQEQAGQCECDVLRALRAGGKPFGSKASQASQQNHNKSGR